MSETRANVTEVENRDQGYMPTVALKTENDGYHVLDEVNHPEMYALALDAIEAGREDDLVVTEEPIRGDIRNLELKD